MISAFYKVKTNSGLRELGNIDGLWNEYHSVEELEEYIAANAAKLAIRSDIEYIIGINVETGKVTERYRVKAEYTVEGF